MFKRCVQDVFQAISVISNTACGNCLKKARSGPAVSGEVGAKGEELDRLGEAAGLVFSAWLVVLLLPGVVPYHPQPEKAMLLVVEGCGGADICLERRETLRGPGVDQLQGGVQGNADGELETKRTILNCCRIQKNSPCTNVGSLKFE